MTKDLGPLRRQAAFDLPGTQRDLFDDEEDTADLALGFIQAEESAGAVSGALFGRDVAGEERTIRWIESNSANRLLEVPACAQLIERDLRSPMPTSDAPATSIQILVEVSALGHVLVIAATIERSLRRFAAAYANALNSEPRIAPSNIGHEVRNQLSESPHPFPISVSGFEIHTVTLDEQNRVTFDLRPSDATPWLHQFPRFACAYAIASVSDSDADVSTHSESILLKMPSARYKIIANGLRGRTVALVLKSPNFGPVRASACAR